MGGVLPGRYGFWRGALEDAVYAFLDCGILDHGFARVRCDECRAEFLVPFSCQRRSFCPSCAAKRGAVFGMLLAEEVLEDVGHSLWTFTLPKMLRPYFLHHRDLLGRLCSAGWDVVRELMVTAVGDPHFQPGMMSVVQTAGDLLAWHPHVHALGTRGGWDRTGRSIPVPFLDPVAAERLFRHRVISLLREEGLLSEERIELLLSWRHSGFGAHNAVTVAAGDTAGIERIGRYLLRSPVSVERMSFAPGVGRVIYQPKGAAGPKGPPEAFEPGDFLARLLQHVPEPRLHQVRYYRRYSNVARAQRAATGVELETPTPGSLASSSEAEPTDRERRRLRKLWAQLIRRVYEVDPLQCRECGAAMRVLAFVLDPTAVRKILAHLEATAGAPSRAPPRASSPSIAAST